MTHFARFDARGVAHWLERHPLILPTAILIVGAAFRFYNLNWDDGFQLHPDERWIFMVVSGANGNPPLSWPSSISQFLDVRRGGSPLDPHFFAYGSLPFYLLALVAGTLSALGQHLPFLSSWSQLSAYNNLPFLGRALSGALDLLALGVLYLIGRRIYGYWVALLAMLLGAFTVLDIQLSHFYAVDTVLLPCALLTLLAAVHIVQTDHPAAYLWGGVAFGAALATKTTALLLIAPLCAAAVLAAWGSAPWPPDRPLWPRLRRHYIQVAPRLHRNLQLALASLAVAAATFVLCEPYAVLDRSQLVSDIAQQTTYLVTNDPPFSVPFTIQYANTVPYLYQLKNLLFWCMGIPLGLAAFAGVLFALLRNVGVRIRAEEAILLLWVLPYFLFVGRFFAKFNRYMLPVTPIMTLLGAALLVWLISRARGRAKVVAWSALAVVTAVSFLYSLAYMNIYEHPNTRVAASRWIFAHIPPGTTIATEGAWDDPLPLGVDGRSGSIYRQAGLNSSQPGLNLYDPDDQRKLANFTDVLTHAQYIIMSSERMIGSIPRLPDRYPMTVRYYRLLLDNKLNFRLVRVFQEHPQLGPVVVHDYSADESFHVYDHPIVRIFRRVSPIAPQEVAALLQGGAPTATVGAPQAPAATGYPLGAPLSVTSPALDRRLMLSGRQWKADQSGPTLDQMFPPHGFAMHHPILVWLAVLEIIGLATFPLCFLLFSHLVDRGFVIAKTLGLLIVGYLVWIGARTGIATYDRGLIVLSLCLLLAFSLLVGYVQRAEMVAYVRSQWRVVLTGELVFLVGFAIFVLLRMWYPDLGHQFSPVSPSNAGDGRMGEKQMELAFLNAIVRSRVFPPYDPFFAHGYINYYYYGFFLVGTLCKLTQIAPATGFNLAIATFFALLVGGVFSVSLNLTRRVFPGLVAALFVGLLGNLNGGWQLLRGLMSVGTVHASTPFVGGVLDVLSGVQQVVVGRQSLPPFDYWESTRIVPPAGLSIAEFPYFTYLFADLHPHLLAYPMTVAALALAVELLLGSPPTWMRAGLSIALGGLLLGAIAVTNPWDYPTYLLVVGIGSLVGAYVLRRRMGWAELRRGLVWSLSIAAVSVALYLPFERDYQTVFSTGIGLVRDITPEMLTSSNVPASQVHDVLMTPLHIYLEHFGLFLFVIASYLALLLLLDTGMGERLRRLPTALQFAWYYRDELPRVRHAMRISRRLAKPREPWVDVPVLTGAAILVVGLLVLQDFLLAFLVALLGLTTLLLMRLARQLPPAQLFVLALVLVPLLLSLGTQIVFIKDWLAQGSTFRMNTIFKFYNQAWVLFAVSAACALYYFAIRQYDLAGDDASVAQRTPREYPATSGGAAPRDQHGPEFAQTPGAMTARRESPPAGQWPGTPWVSPGTLPDSGQLHAAGAVLGTGPLPASVSAFTQVPPGESALSAARSADASELGSERAVPVPYRQRTSLWPDWRYGTQRVPGRPLLLAERRPLWTLCLLLLIATSLIYTYAGAISRETYRTTWLPESSVPFTLDGMAFMRVAYPGDYAGISWLNAHVHGAQVIAEADDAYYNWRSRVSMFTGLPDIINGIHEGEQRYADEIDPTALCGGSSTCLQRFHARADDVKTLYDSPQISDAWRVIRNYDVRYIYVGFSEHQAFSRSGLRKFQRMVGHGLNVAFQKNNTVIYRVTQ